MIEDPDNIFAERAHGMSARILEAVESVIDRYSLCLSLIHI